METGKILSILIGIFISCAQACPSKFKNGTEGMDKIILKCGSSLGIREKDVGKLAELLIEPEQDDKCLSKCLLENLDMVKDDKFDVDAFFVFLEDQAPKTLATKITETATKCGEVAGIEKLNIEKHQAVEVCRIFHKYYACFITNAEKLC